jgi:hypothetical protein
MYQKIELIYILEVKGPFKMAKLLHEKNCFYKIISRSFFKCYILGLFNDSIKVTVNLIVTYKEIKETI